MGFQTFPGTLEDSSGRFSKVVLCSPDRKNLESIKTLASQKLKESDLQKVLFYQLEDFFLFLDKEAAPEASKEVPVKGYKVKVQYQPVNEAEKKAKREAVAQVILQAMKRMKEKE